METAQSNRFIQVAAGFGAAAGNDWRIWRARFEKFNRR